ncbi:MAG: DUF86 domain-containing protein [Eubacteriales bacterium]|nr:DUF86 domain-containing protein [Eubacteriales bacterium]
MRNKIIIQKLLKFADTILSYCETDDRDSFVNNSMLVEACVFNLSQMGELVRHLDEDFKQKYGYVKWHQIYGLRNRIVHDYEGVNLNLVWEIIEADLPDFKEKMERILVDIQERDTEK